MLNAQPEGINSSMTMNDDYKFLSASSPFRWFVLSLTQATPSVTKCHELIWRREVEVGGTVVRCHHTM